ncbi:ATP-binding protein [Kibdelosporangium aridum]|uniref:Anti-sigma regulatory factor (Ser/Thr protein kinase) n=1 Tax=Kibdelosporangium aridum TaxID=2030 RepID=A0A1Y5Y5C9_KIBAR|nr:ATP-binding protein [Kibdelosporangium aridum]SMD25947.1 Anti-sigma regulatory factor (Ser/Thr protein kinase) [Kibdelosporangium aridum]
MLDDDSSLPPLTAWADTLPAFAAEMVTNSDLNQPYIYTELPATPDQAGVVRRSITGWASRIGVSKLLAQDMVLATDEAMSNAIEHAYRGVAGTVTLFAACSSHHTKANIILGDRGVWRPPTVDPGFRGRGLSIMDKLASSRSGARPR